MQMDTREQGSWQGAEKKQSKSFIISELATEPRVLHWRSAIPPPEHMQKPDGETKVTVMEENQNKGPQ